MEKGRINWDLCIIVLAIFNSITIPIQLSFKPPFLDSVMIRYINNMIDLCFILDIVLTFRTTYFNPITGDEINEPKMIA